MMREARQLCCHVPRQELGDFVDAVLIDVGDHVTQVRLGINPVKFGGADQTVDRSCTLSTGI